MKRILMLALVATLAGCGSGGTGGGSAGTGGGTAGTGGGTTGTGGGTTGTGGGTTGTGGGTAGTGGGTAGTGGGTAGTGGGTAGTGGGTAGTGGGAAGTGGGTAGTGGGTGAGGGSGTGGGAPVACALNMPAQCVAPTFCYLSATGGQVGTCLGGCDVVTQNCPMAAEQCSYGQNGARGCFANGTVPEGSDCSAAPCIKGTICLGNQTIQDGGTGPACAKFCRTDNDCVGGRVCSVTVAPPNNNPERPAVCQPAPAACNPFTQDCPNATLGCYPAGTPPPNSGACYPSQNKAAGSTCMAINECIKGTTCAGSATTGNCRVICNADGGTPACTTGTCVGLQGGMGVGVCN